MPSFRQEQTGAPASAGIDAGARGRFIFDDAAHPEAFVINSDGTIRTQGFEIEDIAFAAVGGMEVTQGTSTILSASNFFQRNLPAGATTALGVGGINFPDWWEACDIHIAWSNQGAGAQNVLLAWNVREVNVGETPASGTLISTGLAPTAPPAVGGAITVTVLDATMDLSPGVGLGYVLGAEVGRIGGSDTNAGAMGLIAVGFSRVAG